LKETRNRSSAKYANHIAQKEAEQILRKSLLSSNRYQARYEINKARVLIIVRSEKCAGSPTALADLKGEGMKSKKITDEEVINILKSALVHYGDSAQISKAVEELAELIRSLSKPEFSDRERLDAIIDEIADVQVMLLQLKIIYGAESCERRFDYKMQRLKERITSESLRGNKLGTTGITFQ
jgi:NTP pyrophosphatase (non-canonical NTP hydrolase)